MQRSAGTCKELRSARKWHAKRKRPSAQHGERIRRGPNLATTVMQPLPSRGSPMLSTARTPEGAQIWARWPQNPCLLAVPALVQTQGDAWGYPGASTEQGGTGHTCSSINTCWSSRCIRTRHGARSSAPRRYTRALGNSYAEGGHTGRGLLGRVWRALESK